MRASDARVQHSPGPALFDQVRKEPIDKPDVAMTTSAADAPLPIHRAVRVTSAIGRGRSRPLLIEADDGRDYVIKLKGSAKTARRLIAEVIAGRIAQVIGLPQPDMALLQIDGGIDYADLEPEKQEELESSAGLVFGSLHLPKAASLRRNVKSQVDPELAAAIVWFDSLVVNADRKWRNPNILISEETLWVIDNDSAFQIHHKWADPSKRAKYQISPADGLTWWQFREHALLPYSASIEEAGRRLAQSVSNQVIETAVALPPEQWFVAGFPDGSILEPRQAYADFLQTRMAQRSDFERIADHLRVHGICFER